MRRWGWIVCAAMLTGCHQSIDNHFSGTLELTEHSLGARAAGRLVSVRVEEGDTVSKGQLLATLDRYDQAARDAERATDLYKNGGGSRQSVEQAELTLADQRIVSPVKGVVLVKAHEAGEVVQPGIPVVVVGDRTQLWVRIFIPQGLINRVQKGQKATVHVDGLEQGFPGQVSFISSTAEFTPRNVQTPEERITQTFAVKVTLDSPPDSLRPGVAADVDLLW